MHSFFFAVLCLLSVFCQVLGFGCIQSLAKDREVKYRTCNKPNGKDNDQCGRYNSKRASGQLLKAIDLQAEKGDAVLAPFDATIEAFSYYGDGSAWDAGLKFKGKGQWLNYEATVLHVDPKKTSGDAKKGDVVGHAVDIMTDSPDAMRTKLDAEDSSNFIQFRLKKDGKDIDPTNHFFECSCTGQICETNADNHLVGSYKTHKHWEGFELLCKDKTDGPQSEKIPIIYSPIDGDKMGRIRSVTPSPKDQTYDCDDEGIIIAGMGKWKDFEARIYNVAFTKQPGSYDTEEEQIKTGDPVAKRLSCNGIDTVFIELRHQGKLINFKRQLTGANCTMPKFV